MSPKVRTKWVLHSLLLLKEALPEPVQVPSAAPRGPSCGHSEDKDLAQPNRKPPFQRLLPMCFSK